jgi:hypothetical protein
MAVVLAVFLIAAICPAQNPASAQKQVVAKTNPDDEMLARANKLYYSTTKAGLDGFDCAVHPDWHTVFVSANKGAAVAADDPRVVLLNGVTITLHGRMKGGSNIEWKPARQATPLSQDATNLLNGMQPAVAQIFEGFMQFWTPFVDGSAVPSNSQGLEIIHTEAGTRLHATQGVTSVTEILDSNLVLQHFDTQLAEALIKTNPAYKYTEKGLLVNSFVAFIQPTGVPPEQTQELHVVIDYQTIEGIQIPRRIDASVVNSGVFNFVLDGCTVTRTSALP